MSCVGPSGGALVIIKIVSYGLPKSIFRLQLTITNKVMKIYTGYRNLSTSEYKIENSAKCNTSTRNRDHDIVNEQSSIHMGINVLHSYKTAPMHMLHQSSVALSFSLLSQFLI